MKVNNIDINTQLDPDLPRTMADFHQMQQVFVNIITNAEHAMTRANGRGSLIVKTQQVGGAIRVTLADDGPGIPKDMLNKIFDPFFTTKAVGEGTGLGLSICYGIVEQHGGKIRVASKPGKGTTFIVELPIASEAEGDRKQAEVSATN
jgi:signal transduction histidine kinase